MDKYEYRLKAEQIEKLVKKKDYAGAAKIADTIDWRRVKNVNMLYIVSEIYEATERYGECMEILDIAYDRAPVGRMLLYRMTEVCTKMNNFDEAIALYREFVKVAPHDQSRYILKYQIYRERGSSLEDQIKILNEYKTHEYQEKWAYELAALYDEAGMQEECVRECDELILWFSEGEYVAKALKLKQKYEPLTEAQKEKYHSEVKGAPASIGGDDFEEPEVTEFDPGRFNTMNLQAELAGNLDELLQEDATIDLPDLGFGEAPPEEAEEPDFREDGTIDLPDLGFGEAPPEEAEEPDFREDGTIDLPDLGFGEAPPEEAEEPDFREDGTIDLPVLGFGEEPPEKAEEPDFREDGTIELPDLGFGEEPPEKAEEEPDFREDGTIELPDLGFGEAPPEKAEEPDFREDGTIDLPVFGFGEETPKETEEESEPEPNVWKDGMIELPDSGFGSGTAKETEEEISFPEETSESGHEGTEQLSVNEILDEWEQKKAKTEALLEAGAREEQKRREKVKQETAELIKLIEGVSDMIPEDVQRILQEADEERKARETASVITEDDLPQDLDDEIEEEEEEEEEELAIEFVEEPSSGSEKKRLSGDTTSLNMIQELERSLAAEVSEMAINSGHLTEEQARLFAYFTSVKGMSQQLSVLFKGDSREGMTNSSRGNLIVTGKQGNGKTTLAIDIVKALQKQQQIGGNKLAKISGQKLNTKDVYEVLTRLKGGALIIEGAGGLSDATMMALSLVMEADTGGLLVILEDTAEEIERLFHKNKNFASKFEHSIDIPVFTNDELVAFGTSYALEQEYSFDEFGKLALYDRIGSRQTNDHLVTVAEVKEIIDRAIEHAEKAGVRRILDRITRKSVDEFGNRLLREADFME